MRRNYRKIFLSPVSSQRGTTLRQIAFVYLTFPNSVSKENKQFIYPIENRRFGGSQIHDLTETFFFQLCRKGLLQYSCQSIPKKVCFVKRRIGKIYTFPGNMFSCFVSGRRSFSFSYKGSCVAIFLDFLKARYPLLAP